MPSPRNGTGGGGGGATLSATYFRDPFCQSGVARNRYRESVGQSDSQMRTLKAKLHIMHLQDAYSTGPVRALCELKIGIARQGFGRLLLGFIRRVKGQVRLRKDQKIGTGGGFEGGFH